MESSTFPSPSRNFYSRPCGRGDLEQEGVTMEMKIISTHAPAGGATSLACSWSMSIILFLLTPLREGRQKIKAGQHVSNLFLLTPLREGRRAADPEGLRGKGYFYSRPCGRGDRYANLEKRDREKFLLTPLREGRLCPCSVVFAVCSNFYSRPCGRGDGRRRRRWTRTHHFYSRPCGRGDSSGARLASASVNFYSRPCGRGDLRAGPDLRGSGIDFYSRPCGRGDRR